MKNSMESNLGRALLCGLVLGTAACGGSLNLGGDENVGGGGSSGAGASENGDSGSAGSSVVYPSAGSGGSPPSVPTPGGGSSNVGSGNVAGASPDELPSCANQVDPFSWIAFDSDRDDGDRELYLVRPDGSELTRVTESPGIDKEPAFSQDGEWLAFTSDRSGSLQIHLLELATGAVTQVTSHAGGADQPSFSHDGELLAFHSDASVFTINVDGTDERLVTSGPDALNAYSNPHFTLDDTRIVVDRGNEISVFTRGGGASRMIVQNWTWAIQAPSLSPDGLNVVYSVRCGAQSLWSSPYWANTDPCQGVRITPAGNDSFDSEHPSWGPNDLIAYARVNTSNNSGQIALIERAPEATACAVTELGDDNRNPAWYIP